MQIGGNGCENHKNHKEMRMQRAEMEIATKTGTKAGVTHQQRKRVPRSHTTTAACDMRLVAHTRTTKCTGQQRAGGRAQRDRRSS